jgi:hypothetical protein
MKFLLRWAVTFLAFPLGGFLVLPLTPVENPLTGAIAGAVTGTVVGLVQWWALRGRVGWQWAAGTAAAMSVGMAAAVGVTGGPVSTGSAIATGLLSGAAVGAAQGIALGRGVVVTGIWTMTVSTAWAVGWFLTANVITDVRDGFAIFGASGAAVVTVLTGLALAGIFRMPRAATPAGVPAATPAAAAGAVR